MKLYYIYNGQKEEGPFNREQLKSKDIKGSTLIWYEGLANWTSASEVEELKEVLIIKVTPPPLINPHSEAYRYTSASNVTIGTKTKKWYLNVPLISTLVILAVCLIGWLIFQNSQNSTIIKDLQSQTETQDQFIQTQKKEQSIKETQEAYKEAERKQRNAAIAERNKNYRNNWYDYITVARSQYTYREIGGIYDLEVIITNNTELLIDEVAVQVGYIKTNGDYYKTEIVSIYNIPAKSSKSAPAPDSERGTSVDMTISGIHSKKMNFCYAPGNWANNSPDPYYCK